MRPRRARTQFRVGQPDPEAPAPLRVPACRRGILPSDHGACAHSVAGSEVAAGVTQRPMALRRRNSPNATPRQPNPTARTREIARMRSLAFSCTPPLRVEADRAPPARAARRRCLFRCEALAQRTRAFAPHAIGSVPATGAKQKQAVLVLRVETRVVQLRASCRPLSESDVVWISLPLYNSHCVRAPRFPCIPQT